MLLMPMTLLREEVWCREGERGGFPMLGLFLRNDREVKAGAFTYYRGGSIK